MRRLQIIDYGESANAIKIQIWVTLIANLLLMVMQRGLTRSWSFSGLATISVVIRTISVVIGTISVVIATISVYIALCLRLLPVGAFISIEKMYRYASPSDYPYPKLRLIINLFVYLQP
jgi:hypothetical protein